MKNHTIIIAAFLVLLIQPVFMLVIYPGPITSEVSAHLLADDYLILT